MKKPIVSSGFTRPPVDAVVDRLYDESMWSFINHASPVVINGLSAADQERWARLQVAFGAYGAEPGAAPRETDEVDSGLNEGELCWFAARSVGHVFGDLLRLGGLSSSSALDQLCREAGLPPKSEPLDILLENGLVPEQFPVAMAEFIVASGNMPAFAGFLAQQRVQSLHLDPEDAPSPQV